MVGDVVQSKHAEHTQDLILKMEDVLPEAVVEV